MWAKLALKLFSREFKRGELTVISAAIALAVLTVLTLSMVTDRIGQSIEEKSSLEREYEPILKSQQKIQDALALPAPVAPEIKLED